MRWHVPECGLYSIKSVARVIGTVSSRTARIQTRPAECVLAVLVRPLIDTSDTQAMLRRPDRGDIAGRTRTDNYYVNLSAHLGILLHRFRFKSAITTDSDPREVV